MARLKQRAFPDSTMQEMTAHSCASIIVEVNCLLH